MLLIEPGLGHFGHFEMSSIAVVFSAKKVKWMARSGTMKVKALAALVGRLSLETGPERGQVCFT